MSKVINSTEYGCTKKCRLVDHGASITSILTKKSMPQEKLAAFIAKTCRNFTDVVDNEGRTALHLAASNDKFEVAEWLIKQGANVIDKDTESGQTPLHRAIFYGCVDIAVLLIKNGAPLEIFDNDFYTPLRNCCRMPKHRAVNDDNEIFVWGSNKNYNLGVQSDKEISHPQILEHFKQSGIMIRDMSMSAYHSIFVDTKGSVYMVGLGESGRLGTSNENTLVVPKKVGINRKKGQVISVGAARDHSLILTEGGLFAAGSNKHGQLGLSNCPMSLTFKEVSALNGMSFTRIIAKDYYSIAYSKTHVYVWGRNFGQFGVHTSSDLVANPLKLTTSQFEVTLVEASDGAICIYSSTLRCIFVYSKFSRKSLTIPMTENVVCMSVYGGEMVSASTQVPKNEPFKIVILTDTRVLYVWDDEIQKYVRCLEKIGHPICTHDAIRDDFYKVSWCSGDKLTLIAGGNVYIGKMITKNYSLSLNTEFRGITKKSNISKNSLYKVDFKRIPIIDRAVDFLCNADGSCFAVLQEHSRRFLKLPLLPKNRVNFKTLLLEVNEMDPVHDVIFIVDHERFPAHKFIVFSRAPGLHQFCCEFGESKEVMLSFDGLTGKMFEMILKHIYNESSLCSNDVDEIVDSVGPYSNLTPKEIIRLFKDFSYKFGLVDLAKSIDKNGKPNGDVIQFPQLSCDQLPELYDVTILCSDSQTISAHKCILVSRLEYFNMMFNSSWAETKTVNFTTFPIDYVSRIIRYLYTNEIQKPGEIFSDNYLYNMIVICDQFLVTELKQIFEMKVAEKISIRKCGAMLEFATEYHCEVLEKICLDFISQNLARVLEKHSLDGLDRNALSKINHHYRKMFDVFDFRVITPYDAAIDDDCLESFISDFKMDMTQKLFDEDSSAKKVKQKNKESRNSVLKRSYEKEAIVLLKGLQMENRPKQSPMNKNKVSAIKLEAEAVIENIQSNASKWTKVADKKDVKKSPLVPKLNLNEILKSEPKSPGSFTSLNTIVKRESRLSESPQDDDDEVNICGSFESKCIVNLSDFTPIKSGKLSQKQRKRLSSESASLAIATPITPEVVKAEKKIENAWGVIATSPPASDHFIELVRTTPKGKAIPPKMVSTTPIKVPGTAKNVDMGSPSTSSWHSNSFNAIQESERRMKENYERMCSKSLILTQMEEAAISELKEFYNVDNVFDETITIARRQLTGPNMNYSIWH